MTNPIEAWREMPEPIKRGDDWDANDFLFYRCEFGIKESAALRERLRDVADLAEDLRHRLKMHIVGRGGTHWDGCEHGHNDCSLLEQATAILARLRQEGLV